MIRTFFKRSRNYARDEEGSASVEFVLIFPVYLALMIMSIELGFVTLRGVMLERGMDMVVRDIRLGTADFLVDGKVQHQEVIDAVCENSLILVDCRNSLRLEMAPSDLRAFSSLDTTVDCTNRAEPSEPVLELGAPQANELLLLRACLKYDPLFPKTALGSKLKTDDNGQTRIVSTTAFVREPS
ncbi:MAG: TadE family protein [Pseudomonadota bacterium]